MFENPRRGRQASKKFYNKCSENSKSQIVFRTDIFPKIVVGCPWTVDNSEILYPKKPSTLKNDVMNIDFG